MALHKVDNMPSRLTTHINTEATIAVTGANGFIAQHTISLLLHHGFCVIGTVRTNDKESQVLKTHGHHENLSIVIIDDITDSKRYIDGLNEFKPSAIIHLAAPFHYNATDFETELMIPAVGGSIAVLEAASVLESVKRVIHTSSFASMLDIAAGPCADKTYTAAEWSPLEYTDGVSASHVATAYRASKAAAEKASWRFMETHNVVQFDLVSLCPGMVFGPFLPEAIPKHVQDINTSNRIIWNIVSAGKGATLPGTIGPVWVDVRDVALCFLQALVAADAGGRRFLVAKDTYCNQEIADTVRKCLPEFCGKTPLGTSGWRGKEKYYRIDASETTKCLGVGFRSMAESLKDTVPQLLDIGKDVQ